MGEQLTVVKAHGSSNDIFLIDRPTAALFGTAEDAAAFARHLCDRAGPLGSDGIYFVDDTLAVPRAEFFNPDGTTAELCGNGLRVLARLLLERRGVDDLAIDIGPRRFRTARAAAPGDTDDETTATDVTIELPPVTDAAADVPVVGVGARLLDAPLPALDPTLRFSAVAVPNPHLITVADTFDVDRWRALGEIVTAPSELLPHGANLSVVVPLADDEVFVRTYERGAGPTLSCGSGVVASRTVLTALGLAPAEARVVVRNVGGPARSWLAPTAAEGASMVPSLSGNATFVYRATVDVDSFVRGDVPAIVEQEPFAADRAAFEQRFAANAARLATFGIDVTAAS